MATGSGDADRPQVSQHPCTRCWRPGPPFLPPPGVDPLALARAAWQDLRARRVVSGGSTLTMQLARLLDPRPRTLGAKLAQMALAARIEWTYDKREILAAYLSRAPMGNRLEGFEAGARVYFGKPAAQLSPAEAALLAAITRAPSRDYAWRVLATLRVRRDAVLGLMHALGWLDATALSASRAEPVVLATDPLRYAAPHFLARVGAEIGPLEAGTTRVVTSLEPVLQARVERIVARHLGARPPPVGARWRWSSPTSRAASGSPGRARVGSGARPTGSSTGRGRSGSQARHSSRSPMLPRSTPGSHRPRCWPTFRRASRGLPGRGRHATTTSAFTVR